LIHQEIDSLRGENQNQNLQIALLQEKVGLQANKPDLIRRHQVSTGVTEPPQLISDDFHHAAHRQERPARLLPLQLLFGDQNEDPNHTKPARIFYGPPTNCSDLKKLGYTLNGFYLVNKTEVDSLEDGISHQIETVFCAFKQEPPFNLAAVENPVGLLKIDSNYKSESREEVGNISSVRDVADTLLAQTNASSFANGFLVGQPSKTSIDSSNSSDKLLFHLQIKSSGVIQHIGESVEFDNIILNVNKSYDPKSLAFFAPVDGNYKFVFEAKVLEKKNVTFRFSGRLPPDYSTGWTLTVAAPSDLKNNIVKMVRIVKLSKSIRIKVRTVDTTDGTYTLSASYPTSFKGYLLA